MLLCVAPLVAAPAYASNQLLEAEQLRAVEGNHAVVPLPLPDDIAAPASAASTVELARIARASGAVRVLVGVRSQTDLPAVAAELERLGAHAEAFDSIGVLSATVTDGDALARALGDDPRVAYVERDARLKIAADPYDTLDPNTGYKYTWYYDAVRAADAIAAAGGGSRRTVAVIDSGLDVNHPEFIGRIAHTFDTATRGHDVSDKVGHGTFVTGLITAIDGNGIGGKGVAGNTKVLAIRASRSDEFTTTDLLRGIAYSIKKGADVLNMSLAGDVSRETPTLARALALAFVNDVLPVAASGNTGTDGNAPQFPAAVLGGSRGAPGHRAVGRRHRSERAARGLLNPQQVREHRRTGRQDDCTKGVFSTLPAYTGTEWDIPEPGTCPSDIIASPEARYGYAQGTSFASPIVAGIAALTWQVEPRLASEQVAEVLIRSADQHLGHRLEPVHGRRRSRRQGRRGARPDLRRRLAAREGHRAPQRRARNRTSQEGQGPQRARPRGGRSRELRPARVARRRPQLQLPGQRPSQGLPQGRAT